MKRFCVLLLLLGVLNIGVSVADAQWMPDTNLRNGVRRALGFVSGDVLTKRKILDLTEFNAANLDISDLSGLEFATNLVELDLNGNSISDLSALSGLENLTHLYLRNNDITDVEPLRDLTQLELLWVANNSVSDVEPLRDLTQLEVLWLTNNSVSDISALAGLVNLRDLRFRNNSVSDVSALEGLVNLRALRFPNNSVSDVAPLSGLENLRVLQLAGNSITNTGPLADLVSNLTKPIDIVVFPDRNLELSVRDELGSYGLGSQESVTAEYMEKLKEVAAYTLIRDLSGLEYATNLEELILGGDQRSRQNPIPLSPLSGFAYLERLIVQEKVTGLDTLLTLPSLRDLSFRWAGIADVTVIGQLTDLEKLTLTRNEIIDITPLENLVNLMSLYLDGNRNDSETLSDISALASLENLRELHISSNAISDITSLAGLVKLRELYLSQNNVSDVSALENLVELTSLSFAYNDVRDVSPLGELMKLRSLWLSGNPVENAHVLYPLTQQDPPVNIDIDVPAPVVEVPDAALAALLRTTLELAADADITTADMEKLSTLDASSQGITDLTGLEYAVNLEDLFLDSNSIVDISPLASLTTLRYLLLEDNDISDVSPLSGLVNLGELHLDDNNVSDLTSFAGLVTLTALFVGDNDVSDVSPLSSLVNLEHLDLENNSIVDVSPLANLVGLVKLYVLGNPVENAHLLYPLTQQDPPVIIDIEVPTPVTVKVALALSGRKTAPFEIIITFSEPVSDFEPSDVSFTSDVVTAEITAWNTNDDIRYTATVTPTISEEVGQLTISIPADVAINAENNGNLASNRRNVRIYGGEIVEFPDPNLRDIIQLNTRVQGLSQVITTGSLAATTSWIEIVGFEITDLTGMEHATGIRRLYLRNLNISDVTPLGKMTWLVELRLKGNPILDTRPLYPLTQQDPPVEIDIAVSQFAPWDVNEDGNVDATDTALVTAAIGQSGADIVDSRTDVNGDDTVDAGDLLLVTEHLDDAENASPATLNGIVNLVDTATLESLDRDVLQAQLQILRAESDGSAKYRNAIALLEAFLAATRPEETVLLANYPNPFNPETWIPYHLADASNVRITIYDTRGVVVRRLDLGHQREGYYTSRSRAAYWDGRNAVGERVASGIYFYELAADDISRLRKMVILK